MDSPRGTFEDLSVDMTNKIFRQLGGADLCSAASTCKDFWKYASAVETVETVLHGEQHAFSLAKFMLAHTNDGMKVTNFYCLKITSCTFSQVKVILVLLYTMLSRRITAGETPGIVPAYIR